MPMMDYSTKMFTGHERGQETGLDYMLARYHGGDLPRFLSPDPMNGREADPQSFNRYSYVRNDPLNVIDPHGLYGINPNPYNPKGADPCSGMGPMCKIKIDKSRPKWWRKLVKKRLKEAQRSDPRVKRAIKNLKKSDKTHEIVPWD